MSQITIENLTNQLVATTGYDKSAVHAGLVAIVDQIIDDPDLWDEDSKTLSAAGAELTCAEFRKGFLGGAEQEAIDLLGTIAAQMERMERDGDALAQSRDDLIRYLMGTATPRTIIAEAAGLTLSRMYQICK